MRVYHKTGATQTIVVTPGIEHPMVSDWKDGEGNPITIPVEFKDGMAKVPDNLGKYLLDKDLAQKTRIIVVEKPGIEAVQRGPILITA